MFPIIAIIVALAPPILMLYLIDEVGKGKKLYIFPIISMAGCGAGILQQLIRVKMLSYAGDLGGIQDTIMASIIIAVFLLVITLVLNFLALWGLFTGRGKKAEAIIKQMTEESDAQIVEAASPAAEKPVEPKKEAPVKAMGTAEAPLRLKKKTVEGEAAPAPIPEPEPVPEPEPEIPEMEPVQGAGYKIIEKDTGIEREPLVEQEYHRQTGLLEIVGYFMERKSYEGYQHEQEEKRKKKEAKSKNK